ncbi:MAG: hypothetical protein AB7E51_06680 [Pseudodesulfovibrio sp.]|uniref:hypothetical protein n=1 Tax=Pseudodesulfovibrio sp. TaxID=2035812 RepID=UPI003D109257
MMGLSMQIDQVRTLRIAEVVRRKVQDNPDGIRHDTMLLRKINRGLGPLSQFSDPGALRSFMEGVLGLTLRKFGKPTWQLDERMLSFLVRTAPAIAKREAA